MDKPNGGAAFPRPLSKLGPEEVSPDQEGMTLRDYLAAKAMHAELVTAGALEGPRDALVNAANHAGVPVEEWMAHNAYRMADAMIAERDKG